MAITNWLPDSMGGQWPGPTVPPGYFNLARVAYTDDIRLQMQQANSVLSGACRFETVEGWEKRIDRLNTVTTAQRARGAILGNEAATFSPFQETTVRTVVLRGEPWEVAEPFDVRDRTAMIRLIDNLQPGSVYGNNVIASLGRRWDSIIDIAFDADVNLGDGGGTSSYAGTTASGLLKKDGTNGTLISQFNIAKALELHRILGANDAFVPGKMHIALHPNALASALRDDTANGRLTNFDFNALRPLMSGQVTEYLGFSWHTCTQIAVVADVDSTTGGNQAGSDVFAWNSDAMVAGSGGEIIDVGPSRDRGGTIIMMHHMWLGAVRVDDLGVTKVRCSHDVASPA